MTKADLISLLQLVYDRIPECRCNSPEFCVRHLSFTEEEIEYIRIVVTNAAITNPKPPDPLISGFIAATNQLFEWYDGERAIIAEKGYTCPTTKGAHGMTMLRSTLLQAKKRGYSG